MRDNPSSEYASATAACVNMAVDSIESELEREIEVASQETARVLRRLLNRVRQQRIEVEKLTVNAGLH
jgi:Holliday junction resolvasome RuvABC ATP-dependent DNA helicase subunit